MDADQRSELIIFVVLDHSGVIITIEVPSGADDQHFRSTRTVDVYVYLPMSCEKMMHYRCRFSNAPTHVHAGDDQERQPHWMILEEICFWYVGFRIGEWA